MPPTDQTTPPAAAAPVSSSAPTTTATEFNPSDPAHLATFAGELAARVGIEFTPYNLANCFPCVWSNGRTPTGEWVNIQFLTPGTFNAFGKLNGRTFDRSGRYFGVGPCALAWVVSRVLAHDTTAPTTDTTTAEPAAAG